MRRRIKRPTARALVITSLIATALVCSVIGSAVSSPGAGRAAGEKSPAPADKFAPTALLAGMPFAPPRANLDQVRNGSFDAPIADPDWVNGNAGASNAHYFEGQSIPYRLRLDNLAPGQHVVVIEWDTRHSGVNAIDYITYFDRLPDAVINPLKGLSGNYGSPSHWLLPTPNASNPTIATSSFNALPSDPALDKKFTTYNATGVSFSLTEQAFLDPVTNQPLNQTSTSMQITFTLSAANAGKPVLFAWGGHIASRGDWGSTNGVPNSAGGISGSPYHTRLLSLDGSGGNQDRSLSAAAVKVPAACTDLTGPLTACEGTTASYSKTANLDSNATYTWEIVNSNQATKATFNGTPDGDPSATGGNGISASVNTGSPGTYTVRATPMNAGGSAAACEVTTTVQANTAATDLQAGQDVCPGSPVSFSTTASGGDGSFTYTWKLDNSAFTGDTDGTPGGNHITIDTTNLAPGSHTVEVTVDGSCGPNVVKSTTFNVKTPTALTPTTDTSQTKCEGDTATFAASAVGDGTHNFTWSGPNGPISHGGRFTITSNATSSQLQISGLVPGDSGGYRVDVTGSCNNDFELFNLTVNAKTEVTDEIDAASACDGSPTPKEFVVAATGSGTLSYAWTIDGNPASDSDGVASKLTVNPSTLGVGTHKVKVVVSSSTACGTDESEADFTINSLPTLALAVTHECDAYATITATPSNGVGSVSEWAWTGPDGGIVSGGNTNAVQVSKTGVYQVTVKYKDNLNTECSGNKSGKLCFDPVLQEVESVGSVQVEVPAQAPPAELSHGVVAQVARLLLLFI